MTDWNLPPGCSAQDIERMIGERDDPCDVCGQWVEDCVCPECPECSAYGDPYCYEHHDLVRTFEQTWLYARMEQAQIEKARAEKAWCDAYHLYLESML